MKKYLVFTLIVVLVLLVFTSGFPYSFQFWINLNSSEIKSVVKESETYSFETTEYESKISGEDSSWSLKPLNIGIEERLDKLYFYDANVIYGTKYKYYELSFYKSLDGGKSFAKLTTLRDISLDDIVFISPDIGFFIGSKLKPSSSPMNNGAVVMKTSDGGKNWESVYSTVNVDLNKIAFNSEGLGVVVGRKDIRPYDATHFVLMTKDKGQTWADVSEKLNQIEVSPKGQVADLTTNVLFSQTKGITVLSQGGKIYNTTDEGQSWNLISKVLNEPDQTGIYNFGEFDDGRFWLSGGTISIEGRWGMLSVMNGRRGWNTYRLGNYPFSDIKFLSSEEVLACGARVGENNFGGANEQNKGVVLYSKDSGKTWMKIYESPTAHNFSTFVPLGQNKFLVEGDENSQIILEKR